MNGMEILALLLVAVLIALLTVIHDSRMKKAVQDAYLGLDEAEYFQAVDEMPLDWMGSVSKWVAVYKAIKNGRTVYSWEAKHGQLFEADPFLSSVIRIKHAHGVKAVKS